VTYIEYCKTEENTKVILFVSLSQSYLRCVIVLKLESEQTRHVLHRLSYSFFSTLFRLLPFCCQIYYESTWLVSILRYWVQSYMVSSLGYVVYGFGGTGT